jgi:hypothetical protein
MYPDMGLNNLNYKHKKRISFGPPFCLLDGEKQ